MSKTKHQPIQQIQNQILTIRDSQVMLDRDLAKLYQTETRTLKQAVKRNLDRFPEDFMFEFSDNEINYLVSQSVIPSKSHLGGAKPYAFTEQGVSMLASVIKTPIAVETSIHIVRAFVEMRRFLTHNAEIFQRIYKVEQDQVQLHAKLEKIFRALETRELKPSQGIFYNGQVFDAYRFVRRLIKEAKKSIILIDNYVDEETLYLFSDRRDNTSCTIYTARITKKLKLDLKKYNAQNKSIQLKSFRKSHDRFLIIDGISLYHFGASLKDLGKKWFAFSKMDIDLVNILEQLDKISQ